MLKNSFKYSVALGIFKVQLGKEHRQPCFGCVLMPQRVCVGVSIYVTPPHSWFSCPLDKVILLSP